MTEWTAGPPAGPPSDPIRPPAPGEGPAGSPEPTAVMGRRTLAWFLDLALFLALIGGLYAAQAEYVDIPDLIDDPCGVLEESAGDEAASCLVVGDRAYVLSESEIGVQTLASLGYLLFFVVLQGATGASPGKFLTGLRVVDDQGERAGIGKSFGRTLLWAVDAAPWIVPIVGPIVALTTVGHRRVGDMAAGTYVVSASSVGRPVQVRAAAPPPGQRAWGAQPTWPAAPPTSSPDAPPAPSEGPTLQQRSQSDRFTTRPDVPEAELEIRDLGPPPATAPVDESAPDVGPDPAWWDGPEATPGDEPPADPMQEPPVWEPPTSPGVEDPAQDWQPPVDPGFSEPPAEAPSEPPPFAPPGGEPVRQYPDVADPWGTGSGGTAGTAGGHGPRHVELPPPQWDPARNTYLQWDPNQQAWLQWDYERERWKPIDS